MKGFTLVSVIAATLASVALAAPGKVDDRQVYIPCSGLYGSAQCCATDVLGVADLDCGEPPSTPTDAGSFSAVCSAIGQRARCCVLPILDQGILCNTPAGVDD
ncbi:Fc.00g035460.m01.CDS01 [Cosmosporella sp. VM-42]